MGNYDACHVTASEIVTETEPKTTVIAKLENEWYKQSSVRRYGESERNRQPSDDVIRP